MLKGIVWKKLLSHLPDDWYLIELLVIHSNIWKHKTVYKQMINSKYDYSYKTEIRETI